jgi:hypothetical protein
MMWRGEMREKEAEDTLTRRLRFFERMLSLSLSSWNLGGLPWDPRGHLKSA